jgi:hypothetical protein
MAVTFAHHETLPYLSRVARPQHPRPGGEAFGCSDKDRHPATSTCGGSQAGCQACSSHSSGKSRSKACCNSGQACNTVTRAYRRQTSHASGQTCGTSRQGCARRASCGR